MSKNIISIILNRKINTNNIKITKNILIGLNIDDLYIKYNNYMCISFDNKYLIENIYNEKLIGKIIYKNLIEKVINPKRLLSISQTYKIDVEELLNLYKLN